MARAKQHDESRSKSRLDVANVIEAVQLKLGVSRRAAYDVVMLEFRNRASPFRNYDQCKQFMNKNRKSLGNYATERPDTSVCGQVREVFAGARDAANKLTAFDFDPAVSGASDPRKRQNVLDGDDRNRFIRETAIGLRDDPRVSRHVLTTIGDHRKAWLEAILRTYFHIVGATI